MTAFKQFPNHSECVCVCVWHVLDRHTGSCCICLLTGQLPPSHLPSHSLKIAPQSSSLTSPASRVHVFHRNWPTLNLVSPAPACCHWPPTAEKHPASAFHQQLHKRHNKRMTLYNVWNMFDYALWMITRMNSRNFSWNLVSPKPSENPKTVLKRYLQKFFWNFSPASARTPCENFKGRLLWESMTLALRGKHSTCWMLLLETSRTNSESFTVYPNTSSNLRTGGQWPNISLGFDPKFGYIYSIHIFVGFILLVM